MTIKSPGVFARARALRFLHTIRYLKPSQTLGRVWFKMARPSIDLGPAPLIRHNKAPFVGCSRRSVMRTPRGFHLHEQLVEVPPAGSWESAHSSKLILYHLHYFDDLVANDAGQRSSWHEALLSNWLANNPPGQGTGWEPYVVSLRLVNWIKYWLSPRSFTDHGLGARMEQSTALQARWLYQRLERHLMGNHLWANAKALVFAGTAFTGDEADKWRHKGTALMRREIAEQVLEDGGHFERSPMYQATLLEDLLDLVHLSQCFPGVIDQADIECYARNAKKMLHWLLSMTHPDGLISQFNDAALETAPSPIDLRTYASRIGLDVSSQQSSLLLSQSGYARLEQGAATVFADVAPIGPDYIPGHAHADTLSFEMSLWGKRLFVDGGTSTYERNQLRELERGTAFHNTVVVNGQDSSEVWAAFRVARRARPRDVRCELGRRRHTLSASHDGYLRLNPGVLHHRCWDLQDHGLLIHDRLEGRAQSAEARFRVHPRWSVSATKDSVELRAEDNTVYALFKGVVSPIRVEESHWSYSFGDRRPCKVIIAPFDEQLVSQIRW